MSTIDFPHIKDIHFGSKEELLEDIWQKKQTPWMLKYLIANCFKNSVNNGRKRTATGIGNQPLKH